MGRITFPFWPDWYIASETQDLIGAGSFGKVYKIRRDDLGLQTVSALKVIRVPQDASEVEELRDRSMDEKSIADYYTQTAQGIAEEIRLLLSMKYCPNIVTIEDYHVERNADGIGYTVYIRMPLLESLEERARSRFKTGEGFSSDEIVKIGSDICDALTACEGKKIIHRDIKPANVFIDEFGTFILGDFGIARQMDSATQSMHSQKGTMNYMAPEIIRGETGYDRTVDFYSLGTMLYRLANHNRFPFEPPYPQPISPLDSSSVMMKRLSGAEVPLPDDVPAALGEAIRKACAADPKSRYRSAAEMKQALKQGAAGVFSSPAAQAAAAAAGTVGAGIASTGAGTSGSRGTYNAWNGAPSVPDDDDDSTIGAVGTDLWLQEQKRREAEEARRKAEQARAEEQRRQEAEAKRRKELEAQRAREAEAKRKAEEAARQKQEQEEAARKAAAASAAFKKEKKGGVPKIVYLLAIGVVLYFVYRSTYHDYKPATCTEPETCSICGKTRGEPLGHSWEAATCTEPETCSRCGATNGEPAEHTWIDATCTEPMTCAVCGTTSGEPLGHDYAAATYDKPKTCKRCGVTTGEVKGYVAWDEVTLKASEGTVTLQDFNTHYWSLGTTLKKCRRIKVGYTVTSLDQGSLDCQWGFYVRSDGVWREAGRFSISELNKEYVNTFKLSPSMNVDAFLFEPITRRQITWRSSIRFYEAQVD